jgi:uncharacterized protein involved in exopolysaccharide biosynthesis
MRILNPGPAVASSDDFAGAAARAARGNRRRLQVFASVFILCLVVGMAWNLLRPAEYRAIARIQLTLPALNAAPPPASAPLPASDIGADFVAQVQRLSSRPLLELVQQRLLAAGHRIEAPGGDAVSQLQSMIGVHPVPNSAVVELSATGAPPSLLATALNELVALYREQLLASYSTGDEQRLAQTRDELVRLEQTARERQMQLQRFRGGAGLLSTERDENESVARARGLTNALNAAMEKQATAEARLRALQEAVTVGQGAAAARDDPTLASLEHRASQLREDLRELSRSYTEEFMAMDARARALRTRLSELEAQIVERRAVSQEQALAKAKEDVATAQANVAQLQAQIAAGRQGLGNFSVRFAQARAMEDDLGSIERARREALERLARLEAGQQGRRPAVDLLQPGTPPDRPWRPDYWRDGGLVLAGSLAFGLLAMGLVELFNRPPANAAAAPVTVVLPPAWPALASDGASLRLAPQAAQALTTTLPPDAAAPAALSGPPPRELTQPEAAALLAAAHGPARLACAAWLLGLTTPELMALRMRDIDRTALTLHVGGAWARDVGLPAWFVGKLPPTTAPADAPFLHDADGQVLGESDLQMLLLCAAVDAGLPDSSALTPERLRHTAMAWLVREGLRFADLPRRFGRVDARALADLAALVADVPRRHADEIDPLMPALRVSPPS